MATIIFRKTEAIAKPLKWDFLIASRLILILNMTLSSNDEIISNFVTRTKQLVVDLQNNHCIGR